MTQTPRHTRHHGTCPCGAAGQLWPWRGALRCDGCLVKLEDQRTRELPAGEERKPLTWASWETRPITEAEAGRRVREWGAGGGRGSYWSPK